MLLTGPTEPTAARPLGSVGFLLTPGVYNTELMAPYDVFQHLRSQVKDAPDVFTVAAKKGPVKTSEGLTITPDHTFSDAPPIDLLVVPSAASSMDADLQDRGLIEWVRRSGSRARLLLSLCNGAFVLAKAGLLDGLEATTFPGDQERLGQMFPSAHVQRGVLFVHDGKAVTSVGGMPSYEAALYLVERLYGRKAAESIARGLILRWDLAEIPHREAPGAIVAAVAR
jgi:transcriptional regulator GlxA family with amidase domain